jgi:GGDEF domain-containing protein
MSVLSFRKSVDQLDYAAAQLAAFQQVLARCIRSTAQYPVELQPAAVREFRANLEQLAEEAESLPTTGHAERLEANFRGELRSYRDGAHSELQRLRREMSTVAESMQSFISGLSGSTGDLKETISQEFAVLETTAESGDIAAIRQGIHDASETVIRTCEEAQRAQELVIAQLEDEIRNLHKAVDSERRAALTDGLTGVWNRAKLDSRIKDLLLLNEGFCVFFAGLPSAIHISSADPRIAPEVLRAAAGRLASIAGKDGELGMTGRWNEEVFAIVFNLPLSGAPMSPVLMQQTLEGAYAIQVDGDGIDVAVPIRVRAVDRPKDAPESAFYLQLGQAAFQVTAH